VITIFVKTARLRYLPPAFNYHVSTKVVQLHTIQIKTFDSAINGLSGNI